MKGMKSLTKYEVFLPADYYEFYLQDEEAEGDLADSWDEEAVNRLLAITDGTIGVGTASDYDVVVGIDITDNEPDDNLKEWDKVNECSININSGKLVVAGGGEYFPDAKRIEVPKGTYRVRVYYSGLDELSEDRYGDEDYYKVALWLDSEYKPIKRLK
ncbi:hypothetical protein [Oceanirhabdus sp. W0125-5]|uniref:hypothetical protein n=1 Tax=Oceanirhabdus sp. W0125-5 TaxID=2999116 RepID=UPI0022F2FDFD|nr:hypothetical protein [Oceanirhabdus sp. W0125-5]WBW96291.1 hypothetical protein OW730_21740 [Oceanirhabdus sp. W0125-5]